MDSVLFGTKVRLISDMVPRGCPKSKIYQQNRTLMTQILTDPPEADRFTQIFNLNNYFLVSPINN
jgi:hypothetical protein